MLAFLWVDTASLRSDKRISVTDRTLGFDRFAIEALRMVDRHLGAIHQQ
jgi:hypothetical protein